MTAKTLTPPAPYLPAGYELADVRALKALERGDATSEQQQRALLWLIHSAALTHDIEYRPDSRDHAFASGRRFVGLQIIKLLRIDLAKLKETAEDA